VRTELPEEISRVSAAMTATEEILGFISVKSSERPLDELVKELKNFKLGHCPI
jgi:hypothetical protein